MVSNNIPTNCLKFQIWLCLECNRIVDVKKVIWYSLFNKDTLVNWMKIMLGMIIVVLEIKKYVVMEKLLSHIYVMTKIKGSQF